MSEVIYYGAISLIPVTVVIVTAIITKRALEPLILGALVGYGIIAFNTTEAAGFDFFKDSIGNTIVGYLDGFYITVGENAYFILLFGLFGAYMMFLENTGAIKGFANWGMKFAKTKKITGVFTWLIGMLLFLDNYFSILGAGASMKKIADQNKTSREMFSFTINVTGATICILIPISAWGIFMSGQIEGLNLLGESGMTSFTKSVPFMFYAMIALLFVFLYNTRIIPLFGPMKKAELRAETTGKLFPEGIEEVEEEVSTGAHAPLYNFIIPMALLILVTLTTKELVYGLLVGMLVCSVMYIFQKRMKLGDIFDFLIAGFQDMVLVTAIVISAFVLQGANDSLGLAPYVIDSVQPLISPALLPVIAFIVLGLLSFVTGSFWGMAAIAFPIIVPLALNMDVNPYLAIGAVVAGTSLGSCSCFYCDSVTLTCGTTGIRNNDYLRTAVPLIVPMAILSIVAYTIAGFIMA